MSRPFRHLKQSVPNTRPVYPRPVPTSVASPAPFLVFQGPQVLGYHTQSWFPLWGAGKRNGHTRVQGTWV